MKPDLTPEDVRQISEESGIDHARFCVEQEASQRGFEQCRALFRQLDSIEDDQRKQGQFEIGAMLRDKRETA